MEKKQVLLALSGGLDTTFCAVYLRKEKNMVVHSAIVNTGGFSEEELQRIGTHAQKLGVLSHQVLDITAEYYNRCVRYMIFGNALRNRNYPMSVSSERTFQAIALVEEGLATPAEVDRIVKTSFGFRLGAYGPFEIMDQAGADTYKLKYGHRSHNQPVLELGTDKAYITSQNHGFAINNDTLPEGWDPLFNNLNDDTNEGMKHQSKPFFSTQFHPEASGGPTDTAFLFDVFLKHIEKHRKS